jgi:hypothetical protein
MVPAHHGQHFWTSRTLFVYLASLQLSKLPAPSGNKVLFAQENSRCALYEECIRTDLEFCMWIDAPRDRSESTSFLNRFTRVQFHTPTGIHNIVSIFSDVGAIRLCSDARAAQSKKPVRRKRSD